jgi:poly(ADP-ribose) glycohydrolase ARH3
MHPHLDQLQPYPFERLAQLVAGVEPPADRRTLSLSIGEPQHAPPAFVGDALGMPVEGWPAERIKQRHGEVDEMLDARMGAGTYTDDTQMMIAAGRSLVRCGGVDEADLARAFLEHHDPDRGYGGGTRTVLGLLDDGVAVEAAAGRVFGGQGSYGNGGAMRVASVAVAYAEDRGRLDEAVTRATQVTHAHPLGIEGALLQARAIQVALAASGPRRLDPASVLEGLGTGLSQDHDHVWAPQLSAVQELLSKGEQPRAPEEVVGRLGHDSRAHRSVPAALYAFLANRSSFDAAVTYAVSLGGDTDTIGAMAGALAGALHGTSAVPDRWWRALENGEDGRDEVVALGRVLAGFQVPEVG